MSPQRIQRKRTKGWRMPEGAVYVGRPSKWGNPYKWTDYVAIHYVTGYAETEPHANADEDRRRWAVTDFRHGMVDLDGIQGYPSVEKIRAELAGKDLACWCPLDQPCHADVLMEIANAGGA